MLRALLLGGKQGVLGRVDAILEGVDGHALIQNVHALFVGVHFGGDDLDSLDGAALNLLRGVIEVRYLIANVEFCLHIVKNLVFYWQIPCQTYRSSPSPPIFPRSAREWSLS